MNSVDLVKFVLAGKQGLLGNELEKHASEAPDIHFFVVVAVGHKAFWGTIPAGGDIVSVGSWAMFSFAGAKIS